jgi:hypothetical protein
MNSTRTICLGIILLWGTGMAVCAGETGKTASTNAPTINTNDYKSVFENKGRDPFFPNSSRQALQASAENGADQPAVVLVLKGVSGSANHRLAIINDQTFAIGDENEVLTAAGRIRIHCVEIRDDAAVVVIDGSPEKIDLRLPTHF